MSDYLSIKDLVPNSYNPRKRFDSARMKELEGSIENQGIVQAITVRSLDNGKFEVVAGMRRYTAAKNIGLEKIPVLILSLSDEEAKLLSITENLERADLSPIEEANAFADYLGWDEQHHFEDGKQKDVFALMQILASKIPMSERTIQNRLSLLHLPENIQIRLEQGTLTIKVAEAIARLKELWQIKSVGLSEKELEEQRYIIKAQVHEIMEEIGKTVKTEDEARIRVNKYIEAEKLNLEQREKLANQLKVDLDRAESNLLSFYDEIEKLPSNWDEMDQEQKLEWLELHIQGRIKKLTDDRLEQISKERSLLSSQHDRYLMNLTYVRDLALDTCPHCGAGIVVSTLEKNISKLQEKIQKLSDEENLAGNELKTWRNKNKKFEKLKREYTSKLNTYNSSLKEVLNE